MGTLGQEGRIITHDAPVWRPAEVYLAIVDLSPFGFANMNEQVWLRRLDDTEFEVSCIPFRAYGIALGDKVELHDGRSVARVSQNSGRRVLRVYFTDPRPSMAGLDSRHDLIDEIRSSELLSEWSGDRHVAIDVCEGARMHGIYSSVSAEIEAGSAVWEWADSEPFRSGLSV